MKLKMCFAAAAVALVAVEAPAQNIPLDPGVELELFSQNSNDGYSVFRGVVFSADESFSILGADLWTTAGNPLNATFELWQLSSTQGDILVGANLLGSFNAALSGDLAFHGGDFAAPIDVAAGEDYLIRVGYSEAAAQNWFYAFDPVVFGDPPVDIGAVTIIDGTQGGNTSNFVMPYMNLRVPAPGAFALLGLAGLAWRRRRR
jgi:hypothetical protein